MNAALDRRVTASFGQYSVADVQPSVIARFFNPVDIRAKAAAAVDGR